jgi:hypothetical protein
MSCADTGRATSCVGTVDPIPLEDAMRMMLRVWMPAEAGNAAIKDGSLPRSIKALVERLKPEAAYFFPDEGKRSALYVFEMQDASQIPPIVESLFLGMNAAVTLSPVMNFEDLQKGLAEAMKSR